MDEAARIHPSSWWWIKADGCDIVSGIGESVSGQWSGDVNMDEDALKKCYEKYQEKLDFVKKMGLGPRENNDIFQEDLASIKVQTIDDVRFITSSKCFQPSYSYISAYFL